MKKTVLATVLVLIITTPLLSLPVKAGGIPTIDVAAIAQMVTTLNQLYKQYEMLNQQYSTMKNTLSNMTGSRGYGAILHSQAFQSIMGEAMDDNMRQIMTGGLEALNPRARKYYDQFGLWRVCAGLSGTAKRTCEISQAMSAQYNVDLEDGSQNVLNHLNVIKQLSNKINQTTDQKSIAELQARISAESSVIANLRMEADLRQRRMERMIALKEKQAYEEFNQALHKPASTEELKKLLYRYKVN